MSNNPQQNDNLLSFLKNQSLFNGSPTRKMSSRSRDRKSERNRSPGANQQYQTNYQYSSNVNGPSVNVSYDNNRMNNTSYQAGGNYGSREANYQVSGSLPGGNYQNTTTTTYTTGGNATGNLGVQGNVQLGGQYSSNIQGGNIRSSYDGGNYNVTTTTTTNNAI